MQMKNYILILSIMFASLTANACKNCGCRADKKVKVNTNTKMTHNLMLMLT